MEYQKIINSIDNTPKISVEINDELRGTYDEFNQIRF